MPRHRDGECPEHGDNCPYYAPDRTAGTTNALLSFAEKIADEVPANLAELDYAAELIAEAQRLVRPADPDVIRGIERVTHEHYDPVTDTWSPDEPARPARD